MRSTPADRAAAFMRRSGQCVTTLARLADRLRLGGSALGAALEGDPRFQLVQTPPLLTPVDLGGGAADAAYTRALAAAGLSGTCTVLLVDRGSDPGTAAGLLASTLSRLAAAELPDTVLPPALAAATATAERLPRPGITPPEPLPSRSAEPSTTPPRTAHPGARDRRRTRRPSSPAPPGPGSRPG